MELLCEALARPQDRYRCLHVVGTNGKSSVTVACAALLGEAGLRSGACISPHAWRWSERTRIDGVEVGAGAFAVAVERVAQAVAQVERELPREERITQFEAAIAASFVAFADAGVEVAVVEAGLGGRLDATNVTRSSAAALTSVGLDHTAWLGESELEIAAEKLAVLRDGTTLVVGTLAPEVAELARSTAAERRASLVEAVALDPALLPDGIAPYGARNAAVAAALAATVTPIEEVALRDGLAAAALPGRAELVTGEPPMIIDAAHNEQGAQALVEALPGLADGRPVFACLSILADKDARGIVGALAPALERAVCTAAEPGPAMGRPGGHAANPKIVAELMREAGVSSEAAPDPAAAVSRTLELARRHSGVALCAGSHYLLRYAWTVKRDQSCSR